MVGTAEQPVVVLRLRGRTSLGATFFEVLASYAADLEAAGGRLYVSGADPALLAQMRRNGKVPLGGTLGVYEATDILGESTLAALADAELWLVGEADA